MSRFVDGVIVFVVAAAVAVQPAQAQDRPAPLFEEIRAAPGRSVAPRPRPPSVRVRAVRVDLSLIGGANGTLAPISRLRLNLFLETDFVAVLQRFEQTGSGYAWIGKIEGEPLSSVILVTVDRTVSGSVTVPGRTYAIRAADGVGTVSEIRRASVAEECRRRDPGATGTRRRPRPAAPIRTWPRTMGRSSTSPVVYSGTALRGAASEAQLRADIDLAVATTNQAFSNSGVRTRLRQVHTGPIDYEDSGVALTDLTRLTERSDGIMDDVHSLRDSTGADLVALITERDDTLCGQAYTLNPDSRGDYGFSLTRRECLQYLTFAHEVGHNFGACHDWYVKSTCEGEAFTYSFGHVEPEHRRLTIMAYYNLCEALAIDCDQIAWFSNPRIHIEGTDRPLGVPAGTDTTCPGGRYRPLPLRRRQRAHHLRDGSQSWRGSSASRSVPGRTFPPTLDFGCHGYVEPTRGTRAYNCIPAPRAAAPHADVRSASWIARATKAKSSTTSDQPDRIVFQIRCRAAAGAFKFSPGYTRPLRRVGDETGRHRGGATDSSPDA